jgi:dTDP-4-amino-4,6-dideoxygalactose transaminase
MTYVPFTDLAAQHREVAPEVEAGFAEVLATGAFVGGKQVEAFEQDFAAFCGIRHCIGVGSGADALELVLRTVGVGPGDEVVLPANASVTAAEAIARAGGRPVLVDVDPRTHLMDSRAAATAFGPRTRAVVPVHLHGQVAPMDDLLPVALAAGVAVVEDAARSHGASRAGRAAGGFGLAAATSFAPGGNLGAYGDAGAVLTDDAAVAGTARLLAHHGPARARVHDRLGMTSRLDTLQAVALRANLARLAGRNAARRIAAERYDHLLAGVAGLVRPVTAHGNVHAWHRYVVEVERRDDVLERLRGHGIGVDVHSPVPLHLQPAFAGLGYRAGAFPAAERAASRALSLPLYPTIAGQDVERVVEELRGALVRGALVRGALG